MTSSPADLLLLAALVATTACVVLLHLRLKKLDSLSQDYRRALDEAATALGTAREALTTFSQDGREVLVLLACRIDAAHALMAEMDARSAAGRGGPGRRRALPAPDHP